MNAAKNMIILKGEIKTEEIASCKYNAITKKMDIKFIKGGEYSYSPSSVEWLRKPMVLNPHMYRISRAGREFFDIDAIYVFRGSNDIYWHICFKDHKTGNYAQRELTIIESCLNYGQSKSVFEYIKQIAGLSELKDEETGEKILAKRFEKLSFISSDVALAKYLYPTSLQYNRMKCECIPIFPFGCNNSQYRAVKTAMENQISIIQGPPGTGKTQTILNIIANILMQGKTVQVVSNNNSATENVYEKLASPKYDLGFIVASLGNAKNKTEFIKKQNTDYPDFSKWRLWGNPEIVQNDLYTKSIQLKGIFDSQEKAAKLKQELAQLNTEYEYFRQYVGELEAAANGIKTKRRCSAKQWMKLWQECQIISEKHKRAGVLFKIKVALKYGIYDRGFYKQDIGKIITAFQIMYYKERHEELLCEIRAIEQYLSGFNNGILEAFCNQSMAVLKNCLANRYGGSKQRNLFKETDLWKKPYDILRDYPVVLSTTFSSRNSLHPDVIYDYLIMDEASQVDVVTGALALSCARNVIIVGDTKQLPNVVTEEAKTRAKVIFDSFHIHAGYQFTKSFLQSVLEIMPFVPQTLLREHYRCHPKIINFCNQKFYRGELLIMTEDKGEEDVLTVVKTVQGNHARNHYSQRQVDVIKNEVIPGCSAKTEEIGVITPYKNQVEALKRECKDIEVATVHKFQGKEKDTIIISTVDDEISDFTDDPYLINVAVSRAKKKLVLVVTGNAQTQERNIMDLVNYIQYNNFEVTESKIYSVFDYLYKQYTEERKVYLQKNKKISEYDSENLMYSLICEVLSMDNYSSLAVLHNYPVNMLIKNPDLLNEQECQYVRNPATHVDFLIYNRISKKPVLTIEVDGYEYHQKNTVQASRDLRKDHILEKYEIPLLRFKTNGSREKEKLIELLDKLME